MKGKINQSMSHGLPVVSTSVGVEGMRLVHEESALVADDPLDFAIQVVRLHRDAALWNETIAERSQEHRGTFLAQRSRHEASLNCSKIPAKNGTQKNRRELRLIGFRRKDASYELKRPWSCFVLAGALLSRGLRSRDLCPGDRLFRAVASLSWQHRRHAHRFAQPSSRRVHTRKHDDQMDHGRESTAQVYVSTNNGAEALFASGGEGSSDAPWIQTGMNYEFRLYAGTEHKDLLARVASHP